MTNIAFFTTPIMLYANNYEETNDSHPTIEKFSSAESALGVFRDGAAMSKGTTQSTGLTHSYFANVFGPTQYKELHDKLAAKVFGAAFNSGIFFGILRTRLGIPGLETKGPQEAARSLLELISKTTRK